MASKRSAGLLLYRTRHGAIEAFLVHPGGPFWAKKDEGAWTIPKGEIDEGEDPLAAAMREFAEETGARALQAELPRGMASFVARGLDRHPLYDWID